MKKMKKFLAMFLAMAMVLGMSLTTFAVEPDPQVTTITITGDKVMETTQARWVKILEPVNDNSGYKGWKFADGISEATIGMSLENIVDAKDDGAVPAAATGAINTNLSSLTLNEVDEGKLSTPPKTAEQVEGNYQIKFEDMPAGLYAIKATDTANVYEYSWMVANVNYTEGTTTLAPVTVVAKGSDNQPKKTVTANDQSASENDTVSYTVTVHYPTFATDATQRVFTVSDTITNGTIKEGTLKVGDQTLVDNKKDSKYGLAVNAYAGKNTFTLTLDVDSYAPTLADDEITITYDVLVGAVSESSPLSNSVTTNINNNNSRQAVVITPCKDVTITKTNASGDPIAATNAEFQLYVKYEEGMTDANGDPVTQEVIKTNGTTEVTVVKVGAVKSTENGKATFSGLDVQKTYYVKETKAPEGFAIEEYAHELTGASIKNPDAEPQLSTDPKYKVPTYVTTYEASDYDKITGFAVETNGLNFIDQTLASLPSTGGIGTTIFTIGGCAIMIIAAGLYFSLRRRTAK